MKSTPGAIIRCWRRFAPQAAVRNLRFWRHGPRFAGDFANWNDASEQCSGYDDHEIIERVAAAARAVRSGVAAWERDGTLFSEPAANQPLLDSLLETAGNEPREISLIDFGGALGSTWWQHREWLPNSLVRRWDVVEQTAMAELGRAEFGLAPLRFFSSLDEACSEGTPTTILFSGVLQYLADPFSTLRKVNALGIRYVIFDRTGLNERQRHRLTIQSNGSVFRAVRSYPCWFFDQTKLFHECLPDYHLCKAWPGFDCSNLRGTSFSGCVLIRKQS